MVLPVRNTRGIGQAQMKLNDALPDIEVDPETYEVRADGELLVCEPASELPLAQPYFPYGGRRPDAQDRCRHKRAIRGREPCPAVPARRSSRAAAGGPQRRRD